MGNINILYLCNNHKNEEFIKSNSFNTDSNCFFVSENKNEFEFYKNSLFNFDLIVFHKDKFDFIEEIKQLNPKQFCILITDDFNEEVFEKYNRLKINDYMKHNFSLEELNKKIYKTKQIVKKRKDEELSEILLKQYKETIDENTIVSKTDKDGKIIYVNDKFCDISGYTKDELIGKTHRVVRHPNTPTKTFKELWKTVKKDKKAWKGELENKRKDGKSYWVKATIKPIFNEEGEIIEYIGVRTDITQEQKIKEYFENKFKNSNKQFDNALHLSEQYQICIDKTNSILKTDTENIITFVNDKFCEASGYTSEELIGRNCSEIRDQSHIDDGDFIGLIEKLHRKEMVIKMFKNISKSGILFYMDTVIYPITDIDGNTVEHLQLMHDITPVIELNQEIIDTQKDVVFRLGAMGESRSKETGNHVKRVAQYSYILAKLYGLSEEQAELLKLSSPMHDIGKIAIPDAILNKPGKLTREEFEIMKTHAEIGYNMLSGTNREILQTSATIALTHHERWDGKGYPNGLKGEEIHIFGRITAICDIFDALGSDRVYKKAWKLDKVLQFLEENRGKIFEPKLVDLFLDNLDKFLEIQKKYSDEK